MKYILVIDDPNTKYKYNVWDTVAVQDEEGIYVYYMNARVFMTDNFQELAAFLEGKSQNG